MSIKLNLYKIECSHARIPGAIGKFYRIYEHREFPSADLAETWFRAVYECAAPVTVTLVAVGTDSHPR